MYYLFVVFVSFFLMSMAVLDSSNTIIILADELVYKDVGFDGTEKIVNLHLNVVPEKFLVAERFYVSASIWSLT